MHAALWLVCLALGAAQQAPPPATTATETDLTSVDRVRAALDRPPALRLQAEFPKADFVVHVTEKSWFERVIPPPDYRSGPVPPGGLYGYEQQQRLNPNAPMPLFSIPLLPLLRGIAQGFSSGGQSHAREEVARAIAEYCAAQPNGGTSISICMNPTAIR